jgi:hypothetical protein
VRVSIHPQAAAVKGQHAQRACQQGQLRRHAPCRQAGQAGRRLLGGSVGIKQQPGRRHDQLLPAVAAGVTHPYTHPPISSHLSKASEVRCVR